MAKTDYKIKGGKSKVIINPDKEKLKEAVMRAREKAREAILKQKYDDTSMKADMKTRYGSEKGEQIYYATIRKKAMSKKDKMEEVEFAGNYEGPLYARHPDLVKSEATYPSDFKKGSPVATKKKGRPNAQGPESGKKEIEEDSRRMSNKQHTQRVRQNIKAFGSNFTPPNNYDPDANRGKGEVLTRKQMEKKRRKALRQEETILERGDHWHPDPEQDRKLGGPGANQRAREDRAAASKSNTKSNWKKLRPGESYMDYAKRMKTRKEGYAPGDVDQKVGAVTAIPKKEQDAARARLLAKAAAKRKAMKKESIQIPSFSDFIAEGKGSPEALASLDKVKKRQEVLDKHEKKTGTKLDIKKSPEYKDHKKNFPGAKRTGKKVKGAKETPSETHNRRVNRNVSRIVKKGYTSKEKKEVQSMAKHASRYD